MGYLVKLHSRHFKKPESLAEIPEKYSQEKYPEMLACIRKKLSGKSANLNAIETDVCKQNFPGRVL
jgi:phage-related protein